MTDLARAVVYDRTGGPDVLRLIERDVPPPGPGEVLLRVHRSGVNPTDWKYRSGRTATAPLSEPQTPNQDGAGVVAAVGEGVEQALRGLRVWVWEAARNRPHGTAQDYALVPASHVVPLPDSASFDLGAALGVPFITAHRCLTVTEDGPLRLGPGALAGRTILVAGGAGAVGNAAIQLGRWCDATVIVTVSSPAKAQLARAAGADVVIDYRTQDVVAEVHHVVPSGVHTIVEVNPAANAAIDAQVIAQNGSVAAYADTGNGEMTLPIRTSMTANARWQFVLVYTEPHGAKMRAIEDIAAAVIERRIDVGEHIGLPLHHFVLEQAADAHAAVEAGAVGKVLIDVADDPAQ